MLAQQQPRVNRLPRTGGWDHPADGALHIDAAAGNALLGALDAKWWLEGYAAGKAGQPITILWNAAQRRGYRAAVSWNSEAVN